MNWKGPVNHISLEKVMIAGEFGSSGDAIGRDPGEDDMTRLHASLAIAAVAAIGCWGLLTPAHAAPPTVTPSPGYDARLQEQRAGRTFYGPPVRYSRPARRRHVKRIHDGTR